MTIQPSLLLDTNEIMPSFICFDVGMHVLTSTWMFAMVEEANFSSRVCPVATEVTLE